MAEFLKVAMTAMEHAQDTRTLEMTGKLPLLMF